MRVAHVLHSFDTGGLEKGVATVIRHAAPGFEHAVVCLSRSGATAQLLPRGTPVVELGKPPGHSPAYFWRLSRALAKLRPDVIHTRNWGGVDGIVAARLAGLRAVVHGEHGWGIDDPQGLDRRRIRARRFVSRWVREYTCVSAQMATWLRETVGLTRPLTQIYNGVDTERYKPGAGRAAVRAALGVPAEAFLVGIAGRLDPIKDHPTLFAAFERLRDHEPDARLLVIGDGPERARLVALAGRGVTFLGERHDVPELLSALDAFVLCSLNEGISNTILEAMAAAVPVVATRVGGNPELVEDGICGTLVPPREPAALAGALRAYCTRPKLRSAHGAAARERAVERFGIEAMVRAYEGVWRRVGGPA